MRMLGVFGCDQRFPSMRENLAFTLTPSEGRSVDRCVNDRTRLSRKQVLANFKSVVVICSEPGRLDQNEANRLASKWLTIQVE